MIDERSSESPVAPVPAEAPSQPVPKASQPPRTGADVSQPFVAPVATGTVKTSHTVLWVAIAASAIALAMLLSAVSFGAGVFVGRHGVGIASRGGLREPMSHEYGMPGGRGERRMVPEGPDGRRAPRPGPGRDLRGGRGMWGTPDSTATVPAPGS